MYFFTRLASFSTVLLTLGAIATAVSPVVLSQNASPQETPQTVPSIPTMASFSDVSPDYWARPFIQGLAARNAISGFPDGTFKPDAPVTRAEFAAMVARAFDRNPTRQLAENQLSDVPSNYWGSSAIKEAYETGFLSGYPNNLFQPDREIPKVQAIVALANGLAVTSSNPTSVDLDTYYTDAGAIPDYATAPLTAATQANLVVNYPNVRQLNPTASLTRAEAAALIYQGLVRSGQAPAIASNEVAASYVVGTGMGGGETNESNPVNSPIPNPLNNSTPNPLNTPVPGSPTPNPLNTPTPDNSTPNPVNTPMSGNSDNNIVTVTSANDSFSTLNRALQATGLDRDLQGEGEYTVFAPTNAAFADLPAGTLDRLLQPENRETLSKILRYHLVSQKINSSQLQSGNVPTIEGNNLNVSVGDNNIQINDASVVNPNIEASNGTIHAIDRVLVPPDVNLSQLQTSQNGGTSNLNIRPRLSYIGVGGNIGLGGDSALGEGSFMVYSKVALTNNISVRPAVAIETDPTILLPITYDFRSRTVDPIPGETIQPFAVQPFIGGGIGIETSNDADIGPLITGGVDVPLGENLMLTGNANVLFIDDTDFGLMLGVGYRF